MLLLHVQFLFCGSPKPLINKKAEGTAGDKAVFVLPWLVSTRKNGAVLSGVGFSR